MAIQASLKKAVRRLGSAFDAYAAGRGWERHDYDVYVRYNEHVGRISVVFVASEFEGEGYYERFENVMEFLEEELSDDPDLYRSINLVIWSRAQVESGSILTTPSGDDVPLEEFLTGEPT